MPAHTHHDRSFGHNANQPQSPPAPSPPAPSPASEPNRSNTPESPRAPAATQNPSPSAWSSLPPQRPPTIMSQNVQPAAGDRKSQTAALAELESALPEILAALQVPGLALSVVQDGHHLLHRGFGTRNLDLGAAAAPVTTESLFDLCSVTKHMTAAAVGKLVYDGKLGWTDPVVKYMPQGWQFSNDPQVSAQVTVVDLLSHRTGLAAHDAMQSGRNGQLAASHRNPEMYLPHLGMAGDFRASEIYSNLCYSLVTHLIETISGQAFPDFVGEHLLEPLGIKNVTWCFREFANHPHAALPHVLKSGKSFDAFAADIIYGAPGSASLEERMGSLWGVADGAAGMQMCNDYPLELEPYAGLPETQRDFASTGFLYISTDDVAKWAQCMVNGGKAPSGAQVIHELDMIAQVHNSQSFEADSQPGMIRSLGYGLGLDMFEYNNQPCWAHVGGMPGTLNRLVLLPTTKTSIYIATNCTVGVTYLLTSWLLSILAPSPDPSAAAYTVERAHKSLPNWKFWYLWDGASQYEQLVGPTWPPSAQSLRPLGGGGCDPLDLAGTYVNQAYGYATVLADAYSGEMRMVRAGNENDKMYRVTADMPAEDARKVFGTDVLDLAFFTYSPVDSGCRIRFEKDESAPKDARPAPVRNAGFAWRPRCKYDMVMRVEGLDIVFKRVDW